MSAFSNFSITVPVAIAQGGTGAITAPLARAALGAAASGANADITTMTAVTQISMGGTTNSFPAIQRATTQVRFILADGSNFCDYVAQTGNHSGSVNAQTTTGISYGFGPGGTVVGLNYTGTTIRARLGDDSNFCDLQGLLKTAANATTGLVAGTLAATTNASIVIKDASGQAYRIPCII